MKRWMVKAMTIINETIEAEGPQTQDALYDAIITKAHNERKYNEISSGMSSRSLMQLLNQNYNAIGTKRSKKTGNSVLFYGLRRIKNGILRFTYEEVVRNTCLYCKEMGAPDDCDYTRNESEQITLGVE